MRRDAVLLREAYAESLRKRIIPNYQNKPEPPYYSLANPSEQFLKQARAAYPVQLHNRYQNEEQFALRESLRLTNEWVITVIRDYFSWPPPDDPMVKELLAIFPPGGESPESVLAELSRKKIQHSKDLKFIEERRKLQKQSP
jgi:hypothetical protein